MVDESGVLESGRLSEIVDYEPNDPFHYEVREDDALVENMFTGRALFYEDFEDLKRNLEEGIPDNIKRPGSKPETEANTETKGDRIERCSAVDIGEDTAIYDPEGSQAWIQSDSAVYLENFR